MSRQVVIRSAVAALVLGSMLGCAVVGPRYAGPKYLDPKQPTAFNTVNLESADLQTASNKAVGRLLSSGVWQRTPGTPVLLVDDAHFQSATETLFNTRSLVDLLRDEIVNAGVGQIRVVHGYDDDEDEEEARDWPRQPLRHDYVLQGRVTDVVNTEFHQRRSVAQAYTQISLQVVSADTGEVVFSDLYGVKKGGAITPRLY